MTSWIHVFSKFTPEAFVFEAAAFFFLLALLFGYFIIKRKRLKGAEQQIPASVVQVYLQDVLNNASGLSAELFGHVPGSSGSGEPKVITKVVHVPVAGGEGGGAEAVAKLQELEAQMSQQNSTIEAITREKERMVQEIEAMRAAAVDAPAGGGADGAVVEDLRKKLQALEDRLAEYAVIEDDLANLKRLKQENEKLKAQLAGGGGGSVEPAAPAAPTPAAAPVAEAAPPPAAEPVSAPEPTPPVVAEAAPAPEPASEPAPAVAAAAAPTPAPEPAPAAAQPAPAAPEPAAGATANLPAPFNEPVAATNPAQEAKKDEDLLAEFEKMLNG